MPKVSIIVPVHNPGQYLIPLLESLIYQTFQDIEILLIDDGSTDGSQAILQEYKQKDSRIQVILREQSEYENFGEKYSVDIGRKKAQGDYIMIVDHDDELALDAIEILYSYTINKDIDVIQGRSHAINRITGKYDYITPNDWIKPTLIQNYIQLSFNDLIKHFVTAPISLWTCLIKNDFQKNIELGDYVYNDTDFMWKLKLKARSFLYIPNYIYTHNHYKESVSAQAEKYAFEIFKSCDALKEFLIKNNFYNNIIMQDLYSLFNIYTLSKQINGFNSPELIIEYKKNVSKKIKENNNVSKYLQNDTLALYQELLQNE